MLTLQDAERLELKSEAKRHTKDLDTRAVSVESQPTASATAAIDEADAWRLGSLIGDVHAAICGLATGDRHE